MNFEELLETRDARQTMKVRLPYGYFYKRLIDGKYSNFVEFHDDLADYVTFANSVRTEAAEMEKITDRHQLHFSPNEGEDGVYAIAVEVGNYMTFDQFINENPAIVAKKNFINETISETQKQKGIYLLDKTPANEDGDVILTVEKAGEGVTLETADFTNNIEVGDLQIGKTVDAGEDVVIDLQKEFTFRVRLDKGGETARSYKVSEEDILDNIKYPVDRL